MSEKETSQEEKKPSIAEMKAFYKTQIELAKLRAELAKHHRDSAVYEFERIEAVIKLDMIKNPSNYSEQEPELEVEPTKEEK